MLLGQLPRKVNKMKLREDAKSKHYKPVGTYSIEGDKKREIEKLINDITQLRPQEVRSKTDMYIDPETKELWTYACNHNCWMNQGDPIIYLKGRILRSDPNRKRRNKKNTISPIKESVVVKDDVIVSDEITFTPPKVAFNVNFDKKEVKFKIEDKVDDRLSFTNLELKYGLPKESDLPDNKQFVVIDVTPSLNTKYKINFDFINFMSRYFVGKSIYLIGNKTGYTLDYFLKMRPNTLWLNDKTKQEIFSYIAHSNRFYCFTTSEYLLSAIELNINPITVFHEKDEVLWNVDGIDYVLTQKDIGLEVISDNLGNVLNNK